MSLKTMWPRFMMRGTVADGNYEEKQFASPDAVPEGEGWDFITPPVAAPKADGPSAGEMARLAQKVSELSKDSADKSGEILELTRRLDAVAASNELANEYTASLEAFAKDIAGMDGAPPEVVERVNAILASNSRLNSGSGSEGEAGGKTDKKKPGKK